MDAASFSLASRVSFMHICIIIYMPICKELKVTLQEIRFYRASEKPYGGFSNL